MQSTSESASDAEQLVSRLDRATTRLSEATDRVEAVGESKLHAVDDAISAVTRLLDKYEERATGTGDFQGYIEFQERLAEFVEGLPDDLPGHETFEDAEDHMDQRRLSESDFEEARELVAPARRLAGRLDERREARDAYRRARGAVADRRNELADEIESLEQVKAWGEADLDASTDRLRDPVEAYNDAVRAAFDEFTSEASARDVLAWVESTAWFPLVEYETPPADLHRYVDSDSVGEQPIPTLLEFANYSRSKLSHYVDEADELKRTVATQQTYLERLTAAPLLVAWPPGVAGSLRLRAEEYESAVRRFAAEDVVAALRRVRRLPDRVDYERLREAAVAQHELTEDERELLASGELDDRLDRLRSQRDALADALEEYDAAR